MHKYLLPLEKIFIQHANPVIASGAKAYMKNQFDFFGLPTPLRRSLSKSYLAEGLPPLNEIPRIIKACWNYPEREFQYFGGELLYQYRKDWDESVIRLIRYLLTHKSWWDTVDYLSIDLAGYYFRTHPSEIKSITGSWNRDRNMWLNRGSLLFQNKFRKETDTDLLAEYIFALKDSKEFFIRKAIGWSLREYSKTNPDWVHQFVNGNAISPLSRREALKRIEK